MKNTIISEIDSKIEATVKLLKNLEDMVSFRNLLFHRYGKVDDSRAAPVVKEKLRLMRNSAMSA